MATTACTPAREWLLSAYRRIAPSTWPGSLDEALACPIRSRLICGFARVLQRRAARHPAPGPRPARALPLPKLTFDARRAAANDHDA
jgi:hypothetical protein